MYTLEWKKWIQLWFTSKLILVGAYVGAAGWQGIQTRWFAGGSGHGAGEASSQTDEGIASTGCQVRTAMFIIHK